MSQYGERRIGWPVEESEEALREHLAQLEESYRGVEQNFLRQQAQANQLAQKVRELEIRNLELSASRDQALAELGEWNRHEVVLRQKSEALTRSNHDLEQFASLAAHDLQEPLHSIQVFVDLLRVKNSGSLNEQAQRYLDRVTKAASRMQQLIEGLLLYSRIDAPDSKGEVLVLGEIVQEILSDLGGHIEELQAEIHVGNLPIIVGEAMPIRQVLQNLISNALKFHKPDMIPVLHISGMLIQDRRHAGLGKPGNLCQIDIQDQGIGIPTEFLDKIFGMFQRLHRKDEYEGTGIGLAVCKRIVDQCGGALSVRSTPGEGTTFTVTLPA